MRVDDMSAHMLFLSDAAHLLSHSAPETSAFLMSRRSQVLVETDVPLVESQRQNICSACGHIIMPGWSDSLQFRSDKIATYRKAKKAAQLQTPLAQPRTIPGGVSRVLKCGMCAKTSVRKLEGPARISRSHKTTQQTRISGIIGPQVAPEAVRSANASSKKRAKNRKAGLQALLDQKPGSVSSSGLGLSLSDFMKK